MLRFGQPTLWICLAAFTLGAGAADRFVVSNPTDQTWRLLCDDPYHRPLKAEVRLEAKDEKKILSSNSYPAADYRVIMAMDSHYAGPDKAYIPTKQLPERARFLRRYYGLFKFVIVLPPGATVEVEMLEKNEVGGLVLAPVDHLNLYQHSLSFGRIVYKFNHKPGAKQPESLTFNWPVDRRYPALLVRDESLSVPALKFVLPAWAVKFPQVTEPFPGLSYYRKPKAFWVSEPKWGVVIPDEVPAGLAAPGKPGESTRQERKGSDSSDSD